jgi:hypothetical protein
MPGGAEAQRGAVLILTIVILLVLAGVVLALLSMSALEPQISRNLGDGIRARHLADAGLELGLDHLIALADWGTPPEAPLLAEATLPGLPAVEGRVTVTAAREPDVEATVASVILRATGAFRAVRRTLETRASRLVLPALPATLATLRERLVGAAAILDDRDHRCEADCDIAANWIPGAAAAPPPAPGPVDETLPSRLSALPAARPLEARSACPIALTAGPDGPAAGRLMDGCGLDVMTTLGSREAPALVHVKAAPEAPSVVRIPAGVALRGVGVLTLENVRLEVSGVLDWEGLVVLAGTGGAALAAGSFTEVRGLLVLLDAGGLARVVVPAGGAPALVVRGSRQALARAQSARALHWTSRWRER